MKSVMNLKEISPNVWKAVYRNETGMFTIQVKIDGEETIPIFCSCLGESPCRHVPIIKEAIRQYKLLSEFEQQTNYNSDDYSHLLRTVLDGLDYDELKQHYILESMDLYLMDYLIEKALNYVAQNKFDQAILICKTCIEEYTPWVNFDEHRSSDVIKLDYQTMPVEILEMILFMEEGEYKEKIFNYCKSEIVNPKYQDTLVYHYLADLFMESSAMMGSNDFIEYQDKVIQKLGKDSSDVSELESLKNVFYQYYNYYNNK